MRYHWILRQASESLRSVTSFRLAWFLISVEVSAAARDRHSTHKPLPHQHPDQRCHDGGVSVGSRTVRFGLVSNRQVNPGAGHTPLQKAS